MGKVIAKLIGWLAHAFAEGAVSKKALGMFGVWLSEHMQILHVVMRSLDRSTLETIAVLLFFSAFVVGWLLLPVALWNIVRVMRLKSVEGNDADIVAIKKTRSILFWSALGVLAGSLFFLSGAIFRWVSSSATSDPVDGIEFLILGVLAFGQLLYVGLAVTAMQSGTAGFARLARVGVVVYAVWALSIFWGLTSSVFLALGVATSMYELYFGFRLLRMETADTLSIHRLGWSLCIMAALSLPHDIVEFVWPTVWGVPFTNQGIWELVYGKIQPVVNTVGWFVIAGVFWDSRPKVVSTLEAEPES